MLVLYNEKVAKVIVKTLKNVWCTSPRIQIGILHVFSNKVNYGICKEIGNIKFYIIVDKACDEPMNE